MRRERWKWVRALCAFVGAAVLMLSVPLAANAAPPRVALGSAKKFAILAGQGVTNTGPTVIRGGLGTDPAPAMTGFPPGLVHGPVHRADAAALHAKSALTAAYNDAAGRTGSAVLPQLGGTTLTPGVYNGGALNITGTLTLNGPGVYVFTAASSLVTATHSKVRLINGADPCDVFWQVTSSATLKGPRFAGNILALTSITVGNGVNVRGRLLARNGDVTLINDTIDSASCGGNATTPPGPPRFGLLGTARFLGPCGEPFYAAFFNNRRSTSRERFTFAYTSFLTHRVTRFRKTVAAGRAFTTPHFHVLGSTVMTITGQNGHILRRIRSAPPGNYPPC
jgi:Ice-binding-like